MENEYLLFIWSPDYAANVPLVWLPHVGIKIFDEYPSLQLGKLNIGRNLALAIE